jgi:hypothetical protein
MQGPVITTGPFAFAPLQILAAARLPAPNNPHNTKKPR